MFKKISFAAKSIHARWRAVEFAEIAELYTSRFLRIVAQNLVDVFVTVFLYQSGYSLLEICLLLAMYFGIRALFSFAVAHMVAQFGPKTSLLVSNFLAIPALVSLPMISPEAPYVVIFYFAFQAASLNILTTATDVQFSSIKSDNKAGSEIGFFYIVEKIAAAVSPIVGGFLAFQFGPRAIMGVASIMMLASAIPLFMTPERTRRGQKIIYQGFPWRKVGIQMVSPVVRGASLVASSSLWYIFIALAIFGTSSNAVYAQIGVVASVSLVASIVMSRLYGILIDKKKGIQLLRTGSILNTLVHASRPFVVTPLSVGMVNVANETAASAFSMSIIRGQYDMADKLPGYRVVYFSLTVLFFSIGSGLMCLAAAALIAVFGETDGLRATFFTAALLSPLIMIHGFKSLRVQR